MIEIEVRTPPSLTPDQERILDLHSVLNVVNIIKMQLEILVMEHPSAQVKVGDFIKYLQSSLNKLHDDRESEFMLDPVLELNAPIASALQNMEAESTDPRCKNDCISTARTLESVFFILGDRAAELKRRIHNPDPWSDISIQDLQKMFTELFDAVEKNAKGRYWICYNPARQSPQDYYIDLCFSAENGEKFRIPERLIDVLRDLTLNARKYTQPGGRIILGVHQDAKRFSCCIEDSGIGIPPDELSHVCEFGYRASNAENVRTMGAGFGLTKAVKSILAWGGRFWIASREGVGTRIRFELPNRDL